MSKLFQIPSVAEDVDPGPLALQLITLMMLLVIKITTRYTPARRSGERKEMNSFHIIEREGSFPCFALPDNL